MCFITATTSFQFQRSFTPHLALPSTQTSEKHPHMKIPFSPLTQELQLRLDQAYKAVVTASDLLEVDSTGKFTMMELSLEEAGNTASYPVGSQKVAEFNPRLEYLEEAFLSALWVSRLVQEAEAWGKPLTRTVPSSCFHISFSIVFTALQATSFARHSATRVVSRSSVEFIKACQEHIMVLAFASGKTEIVSELEV